MPGDEGRDNCGASVHSFAIILDRAPRSKFMDELGYSVKMRLLEGKIEAAEANFVRFVDGSHAATLDTMIARALVVVYSRMREGKKGGDLKTSRLVVCHQERSHRCHPEPVGVTTVAARMISLRNQGKETLNYRASSKVSFGR